MIWSSAEAFISLGSSHVLAEHMGLTLVPTAWPMISHEFEPEKGGTGRQSQRITRSADEAADAHTCSINGNELRSMCAGRLTGVHRCMQLNAFARLGLGGGYCAQTRTAMPVNQGGALGGGGAK